MIIGCSNFRPELFNAFMSKMCDDLMNMMNGPIYLNGREVTVHFSWSTMDTEAKSKVLNLGGSSAYHGCWYCKTKGVWVNRYVSDLR